MSLCSYAQVSFGTAEKFNDDWQFSLGDDSLAFSKKKNVRKLTLPHDWSVEGQLSPTFASCQGFLPAGIGWYRKVFKVTDKEDMHFIYFEGVYCRSTVYLNGKKLGHRPNGFASFMYDMTPYLSAGENELLVRVDHSQQADSRWYTGSGIYRDVWIISSGKIHFSQWGLGWQARKINKSSATVDVEMNVEGTMYAKGKLKVVAELQDAQGKVVAKASKSAGEGKVPVSLKVSNPRLWDIDSPYLYRLNTVLMQDDKVIDKASCNVGLRTLKFDANTGFYLNGKNMKVKGVCLHHDAGVLGAVVPKDVWRRRLENLKEMGANAIRMSHNPQAPDLYDLCDELGFLVMDEASDEWEFPKRKWVEGWNAGTPAFFGTFDFFEEWIDRDVADMVRRDRNHPCVFMWSIGNEVDYPNDPYSHPVLDGNNAAINQPMFGGYKKDAPNAERIGKIAKRLSAVVRSIDTSRPVTGALAGVVMSNQTEYPEAIDVVGYNYTENRYDEDHKLYPKRVIYGSETGVGFGNWKDVRDKKHIFGQFIWTGTDYLGESGRWPSRGLNTGLLDFGSFKKPRGWFRASLWSEKPVTYIGTYPIMQRGRRQGARDYVSTDALDTWNYDDGMNIRVVCYTNSAKAHLLLNGKEVGKIKDYDDSNGVIYWDIPYQAGKLVCEGLSKDGKVESSYAITTSLRPYKIVAVADKSTVKGADRVVHITVQVKDENDVLVKLADNNIICTVTGAGQLLGLEGSNNADMGNYRDNMQRVHNGQLLAYIKTTKKGDIKVKFQSPLLQETEVTVKVD
ncbi:MAG: DUF4982 domain-containing protein [Bacteroidaceae bacterium]|nr:DUF4982 domain-containing protein [Bacteroidaceae bacterium]